MRKFFLLTGIFAVLLGIASCSDTVTYQEQRDREIAAINQYIADSAINVISETTFFANDSMTDVSRNEFVLFEASGVYMQIINKGCGEKIKDGETATVLCRFTESNLLLGADSITLTNKFAMPFNGSVVSPTLAVERMSITKTSGTYSGLFDTSSSFMYSYYSSGTSAVVLSGWLVPFAYINLGRPANDGDEIAHVKLIVPHKEGHLTASQNVIPYLYDITFERGR
ncbi:MAG: DUF4827 domain-containing protein [Prevotella sp.]|nr:DUF4827 domain-containing protein [Prevotella sp.]